MVIIGNASSKDRIVTLAEHLDGDIESQTYSEIREAQVYSFRMRVPVIIELPEAAIYLRNQVESSSSSTDDGAVQTGGADTGLGNNDGSNGGLPRP